MFFIYLFLWLIFSMRLSTEIAVAGAIISTAVYRFACIYMRYKPAAERNLLRKMLLGLQYGLILMWEVCKANLAVLKIIFSQTIEVEPRLIYFRTNLKTDVARVALANSITLTPGTFIVALNDGLFCAHCLNKEMAEGMEDSVFVKQLQKFES